MTRRHWLALGIFTLIVAATWIRPRWPVEQALHHSLTAVAVLALVWVQHRWRLPYTSFLLVLAFLTVHSVAARWIYSYVPYDAWTEAVFGVRLNELLGWERNNFDRLVHLGYGLCLAPVLWRVFVDRLGWRRGWAALAAADVVLSTGALYELLEWGIAAVLAPELAEAYNGQQGDIFDPHKDMAVALVGAVSALAIALLTRAARRPGAGLRESADRAGGAARPAAR